MNEMLQLAQQLQPEGGLTCARRSGEACVTSSTVSWWTLCSASGMLAGSSQCGLVPSKAWLPFLPACMLNSVPGGQRNSLSLSSELWGACVHNSLPGWVKRRSLSAPGLLKCVAQLPTERD